MSLRRGALLPTSTTRVSATSNFKSDLALALSLHNKQFPQSRGLSFNHHRSVIALPFLIIGITPITEDYLKPV